MERTLFLNRWYALRPSRLVNPTKPLGVKLLGHDLVLWRNQENQIVVNNNVCPHRGAKLSMGKVTPNKKCIECPYHGWQFDDSGNLVNVPSMQECSLENKLSIDTYTTMESGGLIWFCPGSPASGYNPPVIREMHDKTWTYVTGYDVFDNDWLTTLENSIDITHVNFVHSDFGDRQNGAVKEIDIKTKAVDHLRMYSTINHKSDSALLKFSENPEVRVKHTILLPNTVCIQFWVKDILNVITYVTYTPISDNKTIINWVFLRHPKIPLFDSILDYFFNQGMTKAIIEDKHIVNSLDSTSLDTRLSVQPDIIQEKFRAQLKKMKMYEPTTEH